MNEDVIADLKQFIAATVSQQMSGVATKDDLKDLATKDDIDRLEGEIATVEQKIDDLQESVAEVLDNANDAVEELIEKRPAEHVRRYH
jgi:predicted  nucleic acid-binding Zn-ribbon protein